MVRQAALHDELRFTPYHCDDPRKAAEPSQAIHASDTASLPTFRVCNDNDDGNDARRFVVIILMLMMAMLITIVIETTTTTMVMTLNVSL